MRAEPKKKKTMQPKVHSGATVALDVVLASIVARLSRMERQLDRVLLSLSNRGNQVKAETRDMAKPKRLRIPQRL